MAIAIGLFPWLEDWKLLLQGWAREGSLAAATQKALNLDGVPPALQRLIEQWSEAQWHELPPVELLNFEAMPGAAGAYAISTGTIYLNQHWLESATAEHVRAVLTEELGHHLDSLLNAVDTPGDEGDRLAQLLLGGAGIEQDQSNDQFQLRVKDQWITAEAAETIAPPLQPELIDDSDTGDSNSDHLTNDNTPTFRGTAEPGNTVELFADGISIGSTTADSNGNWTYSVPEASALGDGAYAITAIARDEEPATLQRTPIIVASPTRTHQEFRNHGAFAALKEDGSVVTWGSSSSGGNSSAVSGVLQSGVRQIFSTEKAFAALKEDGAVITWGFSEWGGNSSAVSAELQSGVTQIFSTRGAFAALKEDGSVVIWGSYTYGADSSAVSDAWQSGVTQIFTTHYAFAALKEDGSVITLGRSSYGGNSSAVSAELQSGVNQIFSSRGAFAALKEDGSVVTWGSSSYGGNSSTVSNELQSGVTQIFTTYYAFAALKEDGSVITWGGSGGNSSAVSDALQSGVTQIFSNRAAFAALKEDGSIVTWSDGNGSVVSGELQPGVTQIFATDGSFAALKEDGSVVTWSGGNGSDMSDAVQSGVTQIFATAGAFAALRQDGSVVTWGTSSYGGNSSTVSNELQSGVTQIFSTERAFAALKEDGSIVTWGDSDYGGNSIAVRGELQSGVVSFADPLHDDRLIPVSTLSSEASLPLAITIDTTAPLFSSEVRVVVMTENSGSGQVAYTAAATDESDITYSLKHQNNNDADSFSIDSTTGEVKLTADPNHESQALYAFTVMATDAAGNAAEQEVILAVKDFPEVDRNHSPSGQLLMIGVPMPGASITLDASTINDEDGIDSGFTYGWQVFDRDSETWVDHLSPDATDGDATYTLTNNDEGELFRAQVAYADGNGLTEVVSSESFTVEEAEPVGPQVQQISTPRTTIPYVPGSLISIPLSYSTGNNDNTLSGLTVDVHYDSTVLTPAGDKTNNFGVTGLADADYSFVIQQPDDRNTDGDSSTDEVLRLSWLSMDESFPGTQLPDVIANLTFNTNKEEDGADPITGSAIRFTGQDQPNGFTFAADPLTLQPTPFSLDVDGDGNVSLYTDGIMIIRRLIGLETCTSGFGDDYFNTPNRYSAEQVDALLDQSYAAGMFDFDQNSKTSLYTDGILLIRNLISPYLITDSADIIAPDSPFKTNPEGLNAVFAALKPETTPL